MSTASTCKTIISPLVHMLLISAPKAAKIVTLKSLRMTQHNYEWAEFQTFPLRQVSVHCGSFRNAGGNFPLHIWTLM